MWLLESSTSPTWLAHMAHSVFSLDRDGAEDQTIPCGSVWWRPGWCSGQGPGCLSFAFLAFLQPVISQTCELLFYKWDNSPKRHQGNCPSLPETSHVQWLWDFRGTEHRGCQVPSPGRAQSEEGVLSPKQAKPKRAEMFKRFLISASDDKKCMRLL